VPQVAIWISVFFKSHLAVAGADKAFCSVCLVQCKVPFNMMVLVFKDPI
jgi:hypothetical protein